MKRLAALLLLVLIPGALLAQSKEEQAVRDVRRAVIEAAKAKDRVALERLLAESFTFIHGRGNVETRKQYIDGQVSGQGPQYTFETLDDQFTLYGEHTAILVARSIAKAAGAELNMRTSHVYVKEGERWLWAFGQTTLLPTRPKAAAIDAKLLDLYAGNYQISAGRIVSIVREKDTLVVHIANRRPGELVPKSDTEFVWFNPEVNTDAEFVFVRGEDGKVTHVAFRQDGREGWRAKRID